MIKKISLLPALFLLLISFCKTPMNISYTYSDGSGNQFLISPGSFEYIPVKPENSSSGIYDGGDPLKKKISKKEFKSLSQLLERGISEKDILQNREKGTGMIEKKQGTSYASCILPMENPVKKEIESELKKHRQKNK
jgi:hypothetical protein